MTSWQDFQQQFTYFPRVQLGFEYARMGLPSDFFGAQEVLASRAVAAMEELEKGAIANPDEKRMVGHYWLRAPSLAPTAEITQQIEGTVERIESFAKSVHCGEITGSTGKAFKNVLVVGIGGSALGPQFVTHACRSSRDKLAAFFFDNTDPDGMNRVLSDIPGLDQTLVIVISKSGGTKETRNGLLVAQAAFENAGLAFCKHFVAVTGEGSALEQRAQKEEWLTCFPMWDWVGGRTSELSAVGLLPAALQGYSISDMLEGARIMDELTRSPGIDENPALLMALLWLHATNGRGERSLVVLPYRDRLSLFSKYLQQLIMESLGKEYDLAGERVCQGISVYGNKGSTDQHAYVQQLRDGVNNFFATFVEVLVDETDPASGEFRAGSIVVEEGITSGDYLSGFLQGTKEALRENDRPSMTLTIHEVNEFTIGALIALFERAVGYYATFVNINAYHQPGVEAGKKAASEVIALQSQIQACLSSAGTPLTVEEIADTLGGSSEHERIFRIVSHLSANGRISCVNKSEPIFHRRYHV